MNSYLVNSLFLVAIAFALSLSNIGSSPLSISVSLALVLSILVYSIGTFISTLQDTELSSKKKCGSSKTETDEATGTLNESNTETF